MQEGERRRRQSSSFYSYFSFSKPLEIILIPYSWQAAVPKRKESCSSQSWSWAVLILSVLVQKPCEICSGAWNWKQALHLSRPFYSDNFDFRGNPYYFRCGDVSEMGEKWLPIISSRSYKLVLHWLTSEKALFVMKLHFNWSHTLY